MSANAFSNWLDAMKTSRKEAARMLGISVSMVTRYRREGAPLVIGLACTALYHKLTAWND